MQARINAIGNIAPQYNTMLLQTQLDLIITKLCTL